MSAEASNHDRAEKLIGGWVAGTLTKEERNLLLDASISNQALFDALADEEGLRELLADPAVRHQLLAVLASSSQPAAAPVPAHNWWRWLFRPAPMAAFSAGVLAVLAFVVVRPAFIEKPAQQIAPVGAASEAKAMDAAAPPPVAPTGEKPKEMVAVPSLDELRRSAPPTVAPAPSQPLVLADKLAKVAEPVDIAASSSNKARENEAKPALLAQAPPPPPPASAPAKKAEDGRAEAVSVTGAAPPLVVAPAPRERTVTNAPVLAERADEAKAKRAAATRASPPIRYRVERQQPGGEWVEFGGELSPGTRARIAIDSTQAGQLTIRSGGQTVSLEVAPGQTAHFPAEGNLPADRGEREVAILFQPGPGLQAAAESGLRQTVQTRYRTMQQQAQPGGGPMAGIGGAQTPQQQQQKDTAAAALPGDYNVTVRLRYR